jgi:hypothetical protein
MKKLLLSAFITLLGVITSNAQIGMTGSITTQPCNNDGVFTVTVTGLAAPVSYTYYINGTSVVHLNMNSLTDQLVGFSSNGWNQVYCYASNAVTTVTASAYYNSPFYVNASASPAICPATMGMLSASTASGTPGPFTYNWTEMGSGLSYVGNNISAPVGTYSLIVTDQITGCNVQLSDTATTIAQQSNINVTYTNTSANCTNGTASVTATGGTPPYSYLWNTGANTTSINGLIQGVYTATVTDAQGCVNNYNWGTYVYQSVSVSYSNTVTHATCLQNNGGAMAFGTGGMPPYSYLWSNGQTTQSISGVAGGAIYNLMVTDANGCFYNSGFYIGVTTPINVTYSTTPSSCTAPTGSAGLTINGGTAPYSIVWNTYPATSTGVSVSNLPAGQYGFTVTDAVGCVRTGIAVIPSASTLNANLNVTAVICPATIGSVLSNVYGTNAPFTYSWSNGSTASQLNNVTLGYYTCVITDAVGCSLTRNANLHSTSPITVGLTTTPATCKYTADGSILAIANGGSSPYTYNWSNGQTGATASGLVEGDYWVSVTDANGCVNNYSYASYTHVGYNASNNSCYCTITGKVYADANSNCTIDGGENGIHNIMIHCSGIGYAFTDATGNYSFQVPTGTYTLSETVNTTYPLALCQSNAQIQTVTASSGCLNTVNFANNILPIHDLHIITTSNLPPIPGNTYNQRVIIENNGTLQESGVKIGYVNDGQLGSFIQNPNIFTQVDAVNFPNHYSVQTGFTSLAPGTADEIYLNYNTPTNIPLGTLVNFYDSTAHAAPINTTWLTDYTPWNNVQNYQRTVVASYDPNFKEVSPQGVTSQGYIASKDSLLSYVIHFQNEGTYFAQNISVVDTLDADLDWTSLHPGYADHNYTTTVSENGVITFKFANINLPWKSQYGDLMSSGMVSYTIKRKRNVAQGTQFKNTAAIYFDYNAPVITNTTINTLNDLLSSVEEKGILDNSEVVLYPNPAADNLSISINAKESNKGQINILDITGKVLSSQNMNLENGNTIIYQNTSDLPSGIYFVQVKCNESFITKKLVVIK